MAVMNQKQTLRQPIAMSALPPKDGVIGRRLVDSWKIFGCCASG
jgi:hypothetical protein